MKLDLFFASSSLEERFRRLVTDRKEEIGGWFLLDYVEDHGISRSRLNKVISGASYVIGNVIIVPNESATSAASWSAWDMQKASDLASETAKLYGNWYMHFHTHPGGWTQPSEGDVAFWQWLAGRSRSSFGCIVTDRPLRLWPWSVDVRIAASPSRTTLIKECGSFLSWRGKILKDARK